MIAVLTGIGLFLGIVGTMVYVAGVAYCFFAWVVLGYHDEHTNSAKEIVTKVVWSLLWPLIPVYAFIESKTKGK